MSMAGGAPVVLPSNTPESTCTVSLSRRAVAVGSWPGFRRSSSR